MSQSQPSNPQTEPSWNARKNRRRVTWFGGSLVVIVGLLSAGWFFIAGQVNQIVTAKLDEFTRNGTQVTCAGQDVIGFPFRMGVACDSINVVDARGGLAVEAGALQTAAQVYAPNKVVAELKSPVKVSAAGAGQMVVNWDTMRAALTTRSQVPQRVNIDGESIALQLPETPQLQQLGLNGTGQAGMITAVVEGLPAGIIPQAGYYEGSGQLRDVRLFAAVEKLNLGGVQLPPISLTARAHLEHGASLAISDREFLRRFMAQEGALGIDELRIGFDDSAIDVSGLLRSDAQGFLSGKLVLEIDNPEAAIEQLKTAIPSQASTIDGLGKTIIAMGQPDASVAGRRILPPLTVERGQLRLGILPLGSIPSLNEF